MLACNAAQLKLCYSRFDSVCALVDSVALEMVKAVVDSATSDAAAGEND